jgi:hypothetical protein
MGLFRSRASLQAEILTLRHQLTVNKDSPSQRTVHAVGRILPA